MASLVSRPEVSLKVSWVRGNVDKTRDANVCLAYINNILITRSSSSEMLLRLTTFVLLCFELRMCLVHSGLHSVVSGICLYLNFKFNRVVLLVRICCSGKEEKYPHSLLILSGRKPFLKCAFRSQHLYLAMR